MPKLKTKRAAAKRFRKTANGFKRGQSHRRHILTKKPCKRKRQLRREMHVSESDVKRIKQCLPHAESQEIHHGASKTGCRGRSAAQGKSQEVEARLQRPPQGMPDRQAG